MGVGLNSALLLRYLSRKRYEKKGYEPPHNYLVFFKYLLSYIILASSFLLIITAFHPLFLVSLAVSTMSVRCPSSARRWPRAAATVVLPVPPLPVMKSRRDADIDGILAADRPVDKSTSRRPEANRLRRRPR